MKAAEVGTFVVDPSFLWENNVLLKFGSNPGFLLTPSYYPVAATISRLQVRVCHKTKVILLYYTLRVLAPDRRSNFKGNLLMNYLWLSWFAWSYHKLLLILIWSSAYHIIRHHIVQANKLWILICTTALLLMHVDHVYCGLSHVVWIHYVQRTWWFFPF